VTKNHLILRHKSVISVRCFVYSVQELKIGFKTSKDLNACVGGKLSLAKILVDILQ
jgi:hypothetical protein